MIDLSAVLRRQLLESTVASFNRSELRELLSVELDVRLDRVSGGDNLDDTVLDVIEWAERQGRLPELLAAFRRARPQNVELQAVTGSCLAAFAQERVPTPSTQVTSTPQVFISYKRNVAPDEPLALRLRDALEQAGLRTFIDQRIAVGLDWASEIRRQIEQSDYVLVLLSPASVHSEMVVEEVACAVAQYQRDGKARLLPVRVAFDDPLPYQLSLLLDKLQYAVWRSDGDDARLLQQIRQGMSAQPAEREAAAVLAAPPADTAGARPYADPRFLETLHEPGGAVRADSQFYIGREEDEQLRRELAKSHGTTTTIRAARQTGKSSLLINAVAQAKQRGSKVVYIDLQPIDENNLASLDAFLRYFATTLVAKLRLDQAEVDKAWRGSLGSPDKTTYLLEDYVLPSVQTDIVLALDEADRLLRTPYHDNFFGLLRFWHNSRALDELWDRLNIVMVISTEPHLLIADVTQSPFNVGQKIRLQDFSAEQVAELNRRYRSPCDTAQAADLADYLHGHPYLTHKAIYHLVTDKMAWPDLRRHAPGEQSPFGDHLRRYLWLLRDQPQLRDALRAVLRRGECPDEVSFYRMLQAGLIQGVARTSCTARCKLYQEFFADKL